jgi:hypothetical protein
MAEGLCEYSRMSRRARGITRTPSAACSNASVCEHAPHNQ